MKAGGLKELQAEASAELEIREGPDRLSTVVISFPKAPGELPEEIRCDCGGSAKRFRREAEFPFGRLGVIVRFENVFSYHCSECGLDLSSPAAGQRKVMGEVLHAISGKLTEPDLGAARRERLEVVLAEI